MTIRNVQIDFLSATAIAAFAAFVLIPLIA